MSSILDEFTLCKENVEDMISVGMTQKQIQLAFNLTERELNEWTKQEYGFDRFQIVYDMVRQRAYSQFLQTVAKLGDRGNPSALSIINNALLQMNQENKVVKIVVENNVQLETEEDKNDEQDAGHDL